MAENPRIEELRRRVQKDSGSIAFAQLAEEYRRAGRFQEAIETCRTGLAHHPGYLSAHVTLGRALTETGELDQAREELGRVLVAAPENLAALKGLADIHHRSGDLKEALRQYTRALEYSRHDPELEHVIDQLTRELAPSQPAAPVPGGLSFQEAMDELMAFGDRQQGAPAETPALAAVSEHVEPVEVAPAPPVHAEIEVVPADAAPPEPARVLEAVPTGDTTPTEPRAARQVEALERWLDAILADRERQP